jgi:hypothetical protein
VAELVELSHLFIRGSARRARGILIYVNKRLKQIWQKRFYSIWMLVTSSRRALTSLLMQ